MSQEICILPFFGQGHLLPCIQLCNHLISINFHVTLLTSSTLVTSVPASLREDPLFQITLIPSLHSPKQGLPPNSSHHHEELAKELQNILSNYNSPTRPVCAIVDVMMSWSNDIFKKFEIPTVAFFTSGACSAAMELALWKAETLDMKEDEICILSGLPEDMALTSSDLKQRRRGSPHSHHDFASPPSGRRPEKMGPPKLGEQPPWLDEIRETIALMINTCDDLERPFINYIANHVGKLVWGVGPLLPEQYWKSSGSVIHDRDFRSNRESNVTEEEVIQWLDSKPNRSVLYVSFGSEVGPTREEYKELVQALESCEQPFIWVVQPDAGKRGPPRVILEEELGSSRRGPPRVVLEGEPGSGRRGPSRVVLEGEPTSVKPEEEEGYFPHGLDNRVGNRGLIISGWAPQLLILSHPSTGGFLSHCGWNSTIEAIGRGIPMLAWPIRGDQYHDAKLVVSHLKVGYMVSNDLSKKVTNDDIVNGIQKLMGDEELKKTADVLSAKFRNGFPKRSVDSLDAFKDCINQRFV